MMTREPNANGVKSMDLETIWQLFLSHLQAEEQILNARVQKRAGIPFLYVESELGREELEYSIRKWSARAMRGKGSTRKRFFSGQQETSLCIGTVSMCRRRKCSVVGTSVLIVSVSNKKKSGGMGSA
ncbi:hypothetical protein ACPJHQ_10945 [Rossellomorea sp. H39__3]